MSAGGTAAVGAVWTTPGHAANVQTDLACHNFGIQEARQFTQAEQDVFPGYPLAAKFLIDDDPPFDIRWGNVRRGDGTVVKP